MARLDGVFLLVVGAARTGLVLVDVCFLTTGLGLFSLFWAVTTTLGLLSVVFFVLAIVFGADLLFVVVVPFFVTAGLVDFLQLAGVAEVDLRLAAGLIMVDA